MPGYLGASAIEKWVEQVPFEKSGKLEDQARVALFLVSHLSDHITRETIIVPAEQVMGQ